MKLLDSRRLTGPNLLTDRPGAIIDVGDSADVPGRSHDSPAATLDAWERQARALLDAVGWSEEKTFCRLYPGGASLAITAPADALYAATELNELAWEAAVAETDEDTAADPDASVVIEEAVARLREAIEIERDPALLALREAAAQHGVAFLMDDEQVTVGLGAGSRSWPVDALPVPEQVEWFTVRDIPLALVTGTNGKTTTVRLLAAIARAAGLVAGNTSTDGVQVDGKTVVSGDYTGPEGARTLLRDQRVELAVLEIARGGMLRRGLPVTRADAALVANVAPDHLGDYGICDVESLADAKMVVRRALGPRSRLILNADDPLIVARSANPPCPITWISVAEDPPPAEVQARLASPAGVEDDLWLAREGDIVYRPCGEGPLDGSPESSFMSVDDVPITFGGAARYNVYNVIGAIALARALKLPDDAIRKGLRGFTGTSEQNFGRGNLFDLGGTRVFVDFAHNPHGLVSVLEMVEHLAPSRWLITLGQAGDRNDETIREMARIAQNAGADHFIINDLLGKLRGREPGEVPLLLEQELLRLGTPAGAIEHAASEYDSTEMALKWAQEGDLLLLLLYEDRSRSLDLLRDLSSRGWTPGSAF
jgi:cyanophycin synthetase